MHDPLERSIYSIPPSRGKSYILQHGPLELHCSYIEVQFNVTILYCTVVLIERKIQNQHQAALI